MARARSKSNGANSSANLGFEAKLWAAADKLRSNMDAAEYKHVVLGLIFLKYISDAFEEQHAKLVAGKGDYAGADPEDPDEYRAENVFWVPEGGPLVAPPGERQAAHHRQARRRRDGRHRARQPARSRACCPRTTPARRSTSSASAS